MKTLRLFILLNKQTNQALDSLFANGSKVNDIDNGDQEAGIKVNILALGDIGSARK